VSGQMFMVGTLIGGALVLLWVAYTKIKDWFNY
jgi:hypothetical protein